MSRPTVEHETLAFVPEQVLLQGWEVSYQASEQAGASGLVELVRCARRHLCRCYVFSFLAPLFLGAPSLCCRLCHKVWPLVTEPLLTKRCIMWESSAIHFWIIYRVLMVRDRGQDGAENAGIRWDHEKRWGGVEVLAGGCGNFHSNVVLNRKLEWNTTSKELVFFIPSESRTSEMTRPINTFALQGL